MMFFSAFATCFVCFAGWLQTTGPVSLAFAAALNFVCVFVLAVMRIEDAMEKKNG